jgi:Holliday junction DNA helicase RuvA
MIGQLRGQLTETSLEHIIFDVGGVGYELNCSTNTIENMKLGVESKIFVHTHMREDALTLFGFSSILEKKIFLSLLKVNGVGPKLALKILSGSSLAHLMQMIEAGDVKAISTIPKVGKKTAEQLVLTLKGKLSFEEDEGGFVMKSSAPASARSELVSALVNLGYRLPEVERVVAGIPRELNIEDGLRKGLAALSGQA